MYSSLETSPFIMPYTPKIRHISSRLKHLYCLCQVIKKLIFHFGAPRFVFGALHTKGNNSRPFWVPKLIRNCFFWQVHYEKRCCRSNAFSGLYLTYKTRERWERGWRQFVSVANFDEAYTICLMTFIPLFLAASHHLLENFHIFAGKQKGKKFIIFQKRGSKVEMSACGVKSFLCSSIHCSILWNLLWPTFLRDKNTIHLLL